MKLIKKHFPDLIVAGAKKCGTGTLHTVLNIHPQIAMASGEVAFFGINWAKGLSWYKNRMKRPRFADQIIAESSPGYFNVYKAPEKIIQV